MAIYPHNNLLGCRTIQDWTTVKEEFPQLFDKKIDLNIQRRETIIYFALQRTALFHVCVVSYKGQYQLLHGTQELQVLLDFVLCGTPLIRDTWTLPLPFPGKGTQCTFASLSTRMRNLFLTTKVPHYDFSISTVQEMECLYMHYSTKMSDSICLPML